MAYFSSTKIQERHPIWGSLHSHRGPKTGGVLSFTRWMIVGHQTNLCILIFFYYRNHSCEIWNPPLQIIRKIIQYTRKLNVGKIIHQHEVKSIQGDAMQPFTDICLEAAPSGRGTHGLGRRRTKGMGSAACSAPAPPPLLIRASVSSPEILLVTTYHGGCAIDICETQAGLYQTFEKC